jgi:diguanylate cyclase (GGDEF)-like protein
VSPERRGIGGTVAGLSADLPGFEVLGPLGGGASSTVYRVRRTGKVDDPREYALKLLHRSLGAANSQGLTDLRREAALVTAVDHPGLPQVHEVGIADRRPYLVMDLVQGTSLAEVLNRGALPAERVVALALDVAGPLAAVHARGLVHRDLKPQNVMVLPDGQARLIDFGLTAREGEDEEAAAAVGTLAYSAPEQSGMLKRPVDNRSDLYSLGVILFQARAGVLPFPSHDVGELLRAHASLAPPDLLGLAPETPPELAHVIATLLAKDPDDRYPSGEDLIADLRALGRGPAVERSARVRAPMFGRDSELAVLIRRWDRARSGTGGLCLVRGEAGIGKSRLIAELGDVVERAGGIVLRARALRGDPVPFGPIRAAMDAYLATLARLAPSERSERRSQVREACAGWTPAMLGRVAPGLEALVAEDDPTFAEALGDPAEPGQDLPQDARQSDDRFAPAVATMLIRLARAGQGLLLLVDDVRWSDPGTRQVLKHLAAEIRWAPLLVVATGRPNTADPALIALMENLIPVIDEDLILPDLDEHDVGEQIRSLTPGPALGEDALAALADRSNGNPLIAQEYLWSVLDAGLLWPHWGRWRLDRTGLDELDLPRDALGLLLNRIRQVQPDTRALIVTAAAVGTEFTVGVVAAVEGRAEPHVAAAMAEAVRERLVEARSPAGAFRFRHDRVRQALLADLTVVAGQDRHRRIAEVMAAQPAPAGFTDAGHAIAVARHLLLAGPAADPAGVARACVEAGRLAMEESTAGEAVEFLEHAIRTSPDRNGSALVLLGQALRRTGQLGAARSRLEEALAVEQEPLARAGIYTQLIEVHGDGVQIEEIEDLLRKGFTEARKPLPKNRLWFALSSLVLLLLAMPRRWLPPLRGEARQRALTITGLHEAAFVGATLGMPADLMIGHAFRALFWAERLGSGRRYVVAQTNFGILCAMMGMPRVAERAYRRARADPSASDPRVSALVEVTRLSGAWAQERPLGREWLPQFEKFSPWLDFGPMIESVAVFNLAACFAGRGEEAQYWLDQGRSRMTARGEEVTTFVTAAPMTAALLGRFVEAERELDRLERITRAMGAANHALFRLLATLFVLLEQDEAGEPLDAAIAGLEELRLPNSTLWRAHRPVLYLIAAGRLAQVRAARGTGSPHLDKRMDLARKAVGRLRKGAENQELQALATVAEADLLVLQGHPQWALQRLAAAEPAPDPDLPRVDFEAARVAARALGALDSPRAQRQARTAHAIAVAEGWPHRAAAVVSEFSLTEAEQSGSSGPHHTSASGGHERERLKALEEVGAAASRVLDPRVLARIALDETIRILAADRAFLFLADPDTGTLTQHLGRDAHGQDLAELTGYSTSLVETVRRTGEAQVVAGTEEGAALGAESVVLHGLRSILVAPMLLDGRLLGVVYLDSQVAKGIFTKHDTAVLAALTNHIASSLETARAAQLEIAARTAQRAADVATALQQAQERMAGPVEPLGVLNQLLISANDVLAGDGALVVQSDALLTAAENRPQLKFFDQGRTLAAATQPISGTVVDVPSWLPDQVPGLSSWIALPLRANDLHLGTLVVTAVGDKPPLGDSVEVAAALVAQGMTAYDRAALFERVQELAVVDELTQLANRRRFFEIATRDLKAAVRQGTPLIAMMIDIDHFKRVNDTHGHPTGDDVIAEVARRLAGRVRATDVIGRYGGEEFAVLQPGDDPDLELAEALRAVVAGTPVPTRTGPLDITISVGVSRLRPADEDVATLLARADQGLYRAKENGRNRVALGAG